MERKGEMMDNNDLANKLFAGNFDKSREPVTHLSDPLAPTPMVLTLDQIKHYELNPRIKKNPIYEEIKSSIRQRGFNAVPPVTRRPDQEFYILRDGFNTRLSILHELWKETKDEQFYRFLCQFFPWEKEVKVLTGHLSEDLHANLTFIERAVAVRDAKNLYETELGRELTQGEIADLLTQDGYPIKRSQIQRFQETIDFLLPVIPNALYSGMTSYQIRRLTELRRQTKSVYQKYKGKDNEEYAQLFEAVLTKFDVDAESFNFKRLVDELIGEISQAVGESYNFITLDFEEKTEADETNDLDFGNIEINEVDLLTKPVNIMDLSEEEIIKLPMPQILRSKDPDTETQVQTSIVNEPNNNANLANTSAITDGFDIFDPNDEPLDDDDSADDDDQLPFEEVTPSNFNNGIGTDAVPFQTSQPLASTESPKLDKVEAIKNIIAQASDQIDSPSQPVPTTTGFFPVKDIWQITPDLEDVSRLQQHIGQLVYEIAGEYGLGEFVELNERDLGYICIKSATNHEHILMNMLNDLSKPSQLSAFLLGNFKQFEQISCLSDESLIKLFRVIRLARKLYELEQ